MYSYLVMDKGVEKVKRNLDIKHRSKRVIRFFSSILCFLSSCFCFFLCFLPFFLYMRLYTVTLKVRNFYNCIFLSAVFESRRISHVSKAAKPWLLPIWANFLANRYGKKFQFETIVAFVNIGNVQSFYSNKCGNLLIILSKLNSCFFVRV